MLLRTVVVPQAIVGQTQLFGKHPAFAVILGKEGVKTFLLQIVEGDQRQNSVT